MLAATVAFAATACSSSEDDNGKKIPEGEKTAIRLNLSLSPTAGSTTVNNVWVLQWDAAGNNKVCYKERYHDTKEPLNANLVAGSDMKVAVVAGVDDGTVYTLGTSYADFCKKAYPNRISNDAQVPYAGLQQVTITKEGQSVDLPLKWIAAKISFRIASSTADYTLKSAQVKNIVSPIYLLPGAEPSFTSGDIIVSEMDKTYTYYVGENLQGSESGISSPKDRITTKKGTLVEITATKTADNKRTTTTFVSFYGNNDTDNFDVNRGNTYAQELEIDFNAENDKRLTKTVTDASLNIAEEANSYILSPTETVPLAIPVSRVNDFWEDVYDDTRYAIDDGKNDGAVKKWVAKVIWETEAGLVEITTAEGTEPNGYFVIKPGTAGKSGNVLIGLFDATKGTEIDPTTAKALWSWHIWVTSYNPGGGADNVIPTVSGDPGRTAVEGGYVHYFESLSANTAADGGQVVIMDRDLGALESNPNDLRASTGLFYQWGRKDPFYVKLPADNELPAEGYPVGADGFVVGATDHIAREEGPVSFAKAVQSPTLFIVAKSDFGSTSDADFDWLQQGNGNDLLWYDESNASKKTMYDPCPPGWRVPGKSNTFTSLKPRDVWEPSTFDPTNPKEGEVDEWGYYNQYPLQGVVCWDNRTQFFSNNSGRINCYNGKLFEYSSGQYLFMGGIISKKNIRVMYQHSQMGVNSKEGTMDLIETDYYTYRTSGCSVRCVKE